MSKKWTQLLLVVFLALSSSALYSVDTRLTKPEKSSETFSYEGEFSKIKVSGPFNIHLEKSDHSSLVLNCPPVFREHVKVEIENGVAHLQYKDAFVFSSGNRFICVTVYYQDLSNIGLRGPSRITTKETLKTDQLQINKRGSGSVEMDLEVNQLTLVFRGNSEISLKGECNQMRLTALGMTHFNSPAFIIQDADILVSGSSKILIHAKENLKVHMSGNAELQYLGDPQLSLNKLAGRSTVKPAE